jgi:transposase
MNEVHKCGATIRSKERELIRHVIECCDTEAQNKNLLIPVGKASERAAKYYKVSQCTIKKIRKEGKAHPNEVLNAPGKKRKRPENRNAVVDNFDRRIIQNVMQDFYVNLKTVPTCKKILPILKEKIDFNWSEWTLRRISKDMGFQWKKCCSKRKILIERPDIVNWRCNYLQKIKKI